MKEYQLGGGYKIVKCPNCDSKNVEAVENFDYIKQCKDCGKEFTTGIHN